jgi:hypothetical protein
VTHANAITTFLALGTPEGDPARPSPAARQATIAHLAHCSDCWATVVGLHLATIGEAPPGSAEMDARFGCEAVQDEMWALVALDRGMIAREHAGAARHLGWCLACRTRFAELVAVERELAAAPRWRQVGDRVREAAGRLVVRLGRAAAELVEIPDGFVLGPAVAAVPVRGGDATGQVAQSARFQVGDSGVWAELGVDDAGDGAAELSLRLVSDAPESMSVRVHEARAGGAALVARYTLSGTEPITVRGLWPGSFIVELHDAHAEVHRVRLDVGPGA